MDDRKCLTLLTDFGLHDSYVGVMKGVMAQINPSLTVVDLTHQIPPQNVALASFSLMTAFPYFPKGTIHVAVVDPGVGSRRRAIAVAVGVDSQQPAGILVGPDNGLFSGVLSQNSVIMAVELSNPQYWRTSEPSSTFHGRDLFAPVGAYLASGVSLNELGHEISPETLVKLKLPPVSTERSGNYTVKFKGIIQAVDHFGNLITNISGDLVFGREWNVLVNHQLLPGRQTYSDRPPGEPLALVGSHGWVEIAVSHGNAQSLLQLDWGDGVEVIVKES